MYKCDNCGRKFDYPIEKLTTQSRLFGVEGLPNDEWITIQLCPYCKSDEITEEGEEDDYF